MVILSIILVIVTLAESSILGFRGHLPYTGAFILVLGISFTLLINKKWLYGLAGLIICGVLLYTVYLFEPNWLDVMLNLDKLL